MYCKDVLKAEWDKKRVKKEFYFAFDDKRKDSLTSQRSKYCKYQDDDGFDILFFDSNDGYDIRDMLGFSTNESWQSYKDSIEKKVAITIDNKLVCPSKKDSIPVDRMRSPLLVKPIYDEIGNYKVLLVFQDQEVGMDGFKRQQKICFTSRKEKVIINGKSRPKSFMLSLPQEFSMENYFDYIFNKLRFNIENHVKAEFHNRPEYENLSEIFSELKNCVSK